MATGTDFQSTYDILVNTYNNFNTSLFQGIENQYLCSPKYLTDSSSSTKSDINYIYKLDGGYAPIATTSCNLTTLYNSHINNQLIISYATDNNGGTSNANIPFTGLSGIIDSTSSYTFTPTYTNTYDINLIQCLSIDTTNSSNFTINDSTLLISDMMRGLYAWYNILSPNNWDTFYNGGQVTIKNIDMYSISNVYTISNDMKKIPTTDSNSIILWKIINKVLPINTIISSIKNQSGYFDLYVLRRVFYTHILALNFTIAGKIYKADENNHNSLLLLAAITRLIKTQNDLNSPTSNLLDNIKDNSDKNVTEYNSRLHDVNSTIKKITVEKNIYKSNTIAYSNSKTMISAINKYVIAISVFLLIMIVISTCIIFLNDEIPDIGKKIAAHIQIIASAVLIIVILFRYKAVFRVNEHFAFPPTFETIFDPMSIQQLQNSYISASSTSNYDKFRTVMIDNIITFANSTYFFNNILKVDKAYGDMNLIVNKELDYYTNQLSEMTQQNARLTSAVNLVKISSFSHKYRLYFMLFLTAIISLTIEFWVVTNSHVVLIISLIVTIIAFIYYLIKLSSNVRTDADKYYWTASIKNL